MSQFKVEQVYEPAPIENALHSVKIKIKSLVDYCENKFGTTSFILLSGDGSNFRDTLPLPKKYKYNREGLHKPAHLDAVRRYAHKYTESEVVSGIEADDKIAEYGYQGYLDYLETGVFSYIQCCEDKDALGYNALTFNPRKDDMGAYENPNGIFTEGLGELYMQGNNCKGQGFKWFAYQCFGDDIDGYNAAKSLGIRFGATAKYKYLKDLTTEKECLEAVLSKYKELFGERVQYTSCFGDEMDITYQEYLELHFQCCYMRKYKDDPTTFKSICEEYGANYYGD